MHASFTAATDKLGALIEYFLRTLGAALLLAITIVGIPWAIRLVVRWFFGPQAIMLQDASPRQAISESCRLVTGNWWRTLGNLLLLFLFALPGTVVALALGGMPGLVIASLSSVLVAPIYACAMTLYYMRLQQEKAAAESPPAEAPAV